MEIPLHTFKKDKTGKNLKILIASKDVEQQEL